MEAFLNLLYTIFVCIAGITVFFALQGLIACRLCLRTIHFNLQILTLFLGILWCIFSVSCVLFYFILDVPQNPPELYQLHAYHVPKMIATTIAHSIRLIEVSIAFERLLATIYYKKYETMKIFKIYSLIAIMFSLFVAYCFAFLFNVLKVPALVVYIFLIIVETVNFILLHLLKKQNRLLRELSKSHLLTSKYQITENIRTITLLFPQATISFFISNFTTISTFIISSFWESYRVPMFLSLYCINISAISIYWFYRMKQMKMFTVFKKFVMKTASVSDVKPSKVKTALGGTINMNQTLDEHFDSLKNLWK